MGLCGSKSRQFSLVYLPPMENITLQEVNRTYELKKMEISVAYELYLQTFYKISNKKVEIANVVDYMDTYYPQTALIHRKGRMSFIEYEQDLMDSLDQLLLFNKDLNSKIHVLNNELKGLEELRKETIERDREKLGRASENTLDNMGEMASVENVDVLKGRKSKVNCHESVDQETREKFKKFMVNITKKTFQKMQQEITRKSDDIGVLSCKAFQKGMGKLKEEIILESFEELQKEAISITLTEFLEEVCVKVLEEFLEELFQKLLEEFQEEISKISVDKIPKNMENEIDELLNNSKMTFEQAIMGEDYWRAQEIDSDITPITGLEASFYNCICNIKYKYQVGPVKSI